MKTRLFFLAVLVSNIIAACSSKALDEAQNGNNSATVIQNGPSADVSLDPEETFTINYGYASGLNYNETGNIDMTSWGVLVTSPDKYRLLCINGILKNHEDEDYSEIYFTKVAIPANWKTHKYSELPNQLHFTETLRTAIVDFNYIPNNCAEPYYQTFEIYYVDKQDKLYCKEFTWNEVFVKNELEFPLNNQ